MKTFSNCDDWWSKLTPNRKMHIHRYFHDADNKRNDYMEDPSIDIEGSHRFMEQANGVRCGTPAVEKFLAEPEDLRGHKRDSDGEIIPCSPACLNVLDHDATTCSWCEGTRGQHEPDCPRKLELDAEASMEPYE